MKASHLLLTISIAANLALATLVYSRWSSSTGSAPATDSRNAPALLASKTAAVPAPAAFEVGQHNPSLDDQAYIAQLRANGLPPDIIRALVYDRLRRRASERLRALQKPADYAYWRSRPYNSPYSEYSTPAARAAMRDIYREMAGEAKTLLGSDEAALSPYEKAHRERTMGNLPSEKVPQLDALNQDYQALTEQIRDQSNGIMLRADREQLRLLEQEKRADLAALLTPEELLEYDLRASPSASAMQRKLQFFEPSEAEYRALTQLRLEIDQQFPSSMLTSAEEARRGEMEKAIADKIKAALGPERYASYQVKTDGLYNDTQYFLGTYNADRKNADLIIALKQDMVRRSESVRENPSLTAEQKSAQLSQLEQEATQTITTALGSDLSEKYRKFGGSSWLKRINPQKPSGP